MRFVELTEFFKALGPTVQGISTVVVAAIGWAVARRGGNRERGRNKRRRPPRAGLRLPARKSRRDLRAQNAVSHLEAPDRQSRTKAGASQGGRE